MKEIAFDSLLLIAADDVSQQAINQLRSDGIYSIENRSCTLINMVVVSTAEGFGARYRSRDCGRSGR